MTGAELPVVAAVTTRRPLTIVRAQVRLVERVRVVNQNLLPMTAGWTRGWNAKGPERSLPAVPLVGLTGVVRAGEHRGQATLVAAGVAPGSLGVGTVQVEHLVEAEVCLDDGSVTTARHHLVVTPGTDYRPPAAACRPAVEVGGAHLSFQLEGSATSLLPRAEFRRPMTARVRLSAGVEPMAAGSLDLSLTRCATWQEHYLRKNHAGEIWTERTEQESKLKEYRLGTEPTPALPAGTEHDIVVSVKGLDTNAQTTRTSEGSVTWSLVGVWRAGGKEATGALEVVMAMASVADPPGVAAGRSGS